MWSNTILFAGVVDLTYLCMISSLLSLHKDLLYQNPKNFMKGFLFLAKICCLLRILDFVNWD